MSRLIRLYPRPWRERYEVEFVGLLAERQTTLLERFDIVRGAVDARLHPQVRRPGNATPEPAVSTDDLRVTRRLGIAAVIGGAFWPAAWAVALMGPVMYDDNGAYRDGSAAFPILFIAVALLAAGLVGQVIRLPRSAHVARGSALAAIPLVLLYGMGPWMLEIAMAAAACLVILAVAGARSGLWPRVASLAVAAGCAAAAAIVAVALTTLSGDRMAGALLLTVCSVVLVPIWLAVGATLIRTTMTRAAISG
jgi:hypothetical protein